MSGAGALSVRHSTVAGAPAPQKPGPGPGLRLPSQREHLTQPPRRVTPHGCHLASAHLSLAPVPPTCPVPGRDASVPGLDPFGHAREETDWKQRAGCCSELLTRSYCWVPMSTKLCPHLPLPPRKALCGLGWDTVQHWGASGPSGTEAEPDLGHPVFFLPGVCSALPPAADSHCQQPFVARWRPGPDRGLRALSELHAGAWRLRARGPGPPCSQPRPCPGCQEALSSSTQARPFPSTYLPHVRTVHLSACGKRATAEL